MATKLFKNRGMADIRRIWHAKCINKGKTDFSKGPGK